MLTNGGGILETKRAQVLNKIVWGSEATKAGEPRITADRMILCHTPLRDLKHKYADKYVLVTGMGDINEICADYGYQRAIHIEEVYAMCPQASPLQQNSFAPGRL